MRDINLIPRKPYVEKAFVPLLAGTIGVSLLAAVLISTFVVRYHGNVDTLLSQIGQMQKRIDQLNALRQVDQRTQLYNKMNADVTKLKENRRYWIPVFELLSHNVPPTARVVTMGVKDRERMTLNMEFADWRQAAEYVAALQQSGLFETVQVAGIEKQEKNAVSAVKPEVAPTALPSALTIPGTTQTAPPSAGSGVKELSPEEYIQSIVSGQKPAASKSDELLNELNWIINQQVSKQKFQLELPDKASQTGRSNGSGVITGTSPFSKQELEAAQKSLEDLKKTQIKGKTGTGGTAGQSKQANTAKQTEQPEAATVIYYNVSFDLTLKQLSKSK